MPENACPRCGGAMERGFLSTTAGSGLFWSHHEEAIRFRPHDLEVLVPTRFGGNSSANLPGSRCGACGTILLERGGPR
jgi:hypothetical protein